MMVLADTTVWVDHWRRGNAAFARLLETNRVVTHPYVIGELSLGVLKGRGEVLANLRALRRSRLAEQDEVFGLIDRKRLWGRGIGWVDVNLLASALLDGNRLWTLDRPLASAAHQLGVG